jgi:general secretion pathway protein C
MVAGAAYYGARGASALVADELIPDPQALAGNAPPPTAPSAVATATPGRARIVLERNVFDSVTGPLYPAAASIGEAPARSQPTDPLHAPRCEQIHVFSTAESTDPEWSTAVVQGPGEKHGRVRRPGDEVAGHELVYIGYNPVDRSPAVWLETPSELCQAVLFDKTPRTVAAPPPKVKAKRGSPPKPKPGPSGVPPDLKKKIQKVSGMEFAVDRGAVDQIMNDYSKLMRGTRVTPVQKGGRVTGVKLNGIRGNSLLQTLGLKNGDEVQSINGFKMTSPEQALQAYAKLRTTSSIRVQVVRNGRPAVIEFAIK